MRNRIIALAVAGLALLALPSFGDDAAKAKKDVAKDEAKTETITGEIVDTACFLAHGARGEKHASCAAKCINGGTPMGLLTDEGALYLLTPNHDDADAYMKLKEMAAKSVAVTGMVMERNGMKGIDVIGYKAVAVNVETKKADAK